MLVTLEHLWAIGVLGNMEEWLQVDRDVLEEAILVLLPDKSPKDVWKGDFTILVAELKAKSEEISAIVDQTESKIVSHEVDQWLSENG